MPDRLCYPSQLFLRSLFLEGSECSPTRRAEILAEPWVIMGSEMEAGMSTPKTPKPPNPKPSTLHPKPQVMAHVYG